MLILFPKSELQRFIFFCDIGMLIQIITEVQLVIVPGVSQMDMIHFVHKFIFGIALIELRTIVMPAIV